MGRGKIFLTAALICAASAAWGAQASAQAAGAVVRIGLVDNFAPSFYINSYAPTIQYLKERFPQYRFESVEFAGAREIEKTRERLDFVVSSSGSFAHMRTQMGLEQIVVRKPVAVSKASESVSGVMLVLEDRKDLQTLSDLKGKVMVSANARIFGGYVALLDEIARSGYDPDRFFAEKRFTEFHYPDEISLLSLGRADVAFLSSCRLEELVRDGLVSRQSLRVINDRTQPGERCMRSTLRLPGEIFATTPQVSPDVAKDVTIALLQMPREDRDWEWVPATDLVAVNAVLERLKIGPYSYLRERTPTVFFDRYRMQITLGLLFVGLLIVAVVLHIHRTNVLIRRRTGELVQMIREKEALIGQANKTQHYLHLLERSNLVSQLSSMFAHEIKQPVTNIINYAAGLKMLAQKGRGAEPETQTVLTVIADQAQRVADIVERVRVYAKGRPYVVSECRLSDVIDRLIEDFLLGQSSRARIEKSVPGDIVLSADPVALELLFLNLLRNADHALLDVRSPVIRISAVSSAGFVRIIVSDNGPGVPEPLIARLGQPGAVAEPSGLGMGLAIAVGIAETHKGHMEFQNRPEGGFVATVILPAAGSGIAPAEASRATRVKLPDDL